MCFVVDVPYCRMHKRLYLFDHPRQPRQRTKYRSTRRHLYGGLIELNCSLVARSKRILKWKIQQHAADRKLNLVLYNMERRTT